tara:strand:+ start:343 stop:987 length:645 start_codon:yes stop_codon:yes gene_type:complete
MDILYESGIPCPSELTPTQVTDTLERARVACDTALDMKSKGVDITPTEKDKEEARSLMTDYAEAEASKDKKNIPAVSGTGAALHLGVLLSKYDTQVVKNAVQVKSYVTNRLIEESETAKDSGRIRALELLGKDVGMFTDKTEVTITSKSTEELEKELQTRLSRILDAKFIDSAVDIEEIDDESEYIGEESEVDEMGEISEFRGDKEVSEGSEPN